MKCPDVRAVRKASSARYLASLVVRSTLASLQVAPLRALVDMYEARHFTHLLHVKLLPCPPVWKIPEVHWFAGDQALDMSAHHNVGRIKAMISFLPVMWRLKSLGACTETFVLIKSSY